MFILGNAVFFVTTVACKSHGTKLRAQRLGFLRARIHQFIGFCFQAFGFSGEVVPVLRGSRLVPLKRVFILLASGKVPKEPRMLRLLPRKPRMRAALVVVVLYALCVVSPPLALAFMDGSAAAHCLTDDHHGANVQHEPGLTHFHDEGGPLGQSSDHDKGRSDNCCGLFCVTAGAIPLVPALAEPARATTMDVIFGGALGGRANDRIDRPPRSLPSL